MKAKNIDEYIAGFARDIQSSLEQVRATIHKAAPGAEERISYGIPAFRLDGKYLIYFAAHKKHIGLYPVPTGVVAFEKDFSRYHTSGKGTIRFPLDKPMPLRLIARIVKYRIGKNPENTARTKSAKRHYGVAKG